VIQSKNLFNLGYLPLSKKSANSVGQLNTDPITSFENFMSLELYFRGFMYVLRVSY